MVFDGISLTATWHNCRSVDFIWMGTSDQSKDIEQRVSGMFQNI